MLVKLILCPYHIRRILLWKILISIALTCCTSSTPPPPTYTRFLRAFRYCEQQGHNERFTSCGSVTNRLIQRIKDLVYSFCVFATRNATVMSSQWRHTRCPKRIRVLALPAGSFMDSGISISLCLSMAVQLFVPWTLLQFLDRIHSRYDSLDGGSASRKAATYTHNNTNTEWTYTGIYASSWIGTHDPSVREHEDCSRLKPRGHCDRPFLSLAEP
jgi:hypothetical protein